MSKRRLARLLRAAGAVTLVAAMVPLSAGSATASQGGEDHKVTLCHRTNSESNPYVEITIDKAGVFKTGHDGHDEGGVYVSGDKARGVRWGDIIPSFTYFKSPKDSTQLTYPGLNNGAAGAAILANNCNVPGVPPPEKPEPAGSISGECVESNDTFVVTGTLDYDGSTDVAFRLLLSTGATIALDGTEVNEVITAAAGTKVQLQFRVGHHGDWTDTDHPVTVTSCPPLSINATGGFTVVCDADGAAVTIGTLSAEPGVTWRLAVNGTTQRVESNQVVQVPGGASLDLRWRLQGEDTSEQKATAPAACPEQGTVDKTSSPASGSTVPAGSTIDYTVTVRNTGGVALTGKPVVDTLPTLVTVPGTPSDGGVVSGDGRTVTWTVTLAPGASKVLGYRGLVSASAPAASVLLNTVRFLGLEDTTTHTVGSRGLTVTKSVSPTGPAAVGATLTYTLSVRATGTLPQSAVVVTDPVPAGTTYVTGSAACDAPGTCTPTLTGNVLSWPLGAMEPNAVRSVSFRVTINALTVPVGTAVTIRNSGAAQSAEVPSTPSNEVLTPVVAPAVAVAGTKVGADTPAGTPAGGGSPPATDEGSPPPAADDAAEETPETEVLGTKTGTDDALAATGSGLTEGALVVLAGVLLLLGAVLVRVATWRSRP